MQVQLSVYTIYVINYFKSDVKILLPVYNLKRLN